MSPPSSFADSPTRAGVTGIGRQKGQKEYGDEAAFRFVLRVFVGCLGVFPKGQPFN
jgi:hypothetical protein